MSPYRVLMIDDDPTTQDVLGEYLRLGGYEVRSARSGREGLALAHAEPPDLVLLDVQMPEMDGFAVLQAMKEMPEMALVPVLLLTTLDRSYLKVKGLEAGADDYITKPFDRAELMARVKVALRRTSKYRRRTTALTGELASLGLADVLQTLEVGAKTARVTLPEMDADIELASGMLLRVRFASFTGEDAFRRLFIVERGSFAVTIEPSPGTALSAESARHVGELLLSALTYADEVRRVLSPLASLTAVVGSAGDLHAWPTLAAVEARLPLPLGVLVATAPAGPLETAAAVVAAAQAHALDVGTPAPGGE